jgi:hypothetical protein
MHCGSPRTQAMTRAAAIPPNSQVAETASVR